MKTLVGSPLRSAQPRILVLDDEPQIHRFLSPALEAAGFIPMRSETGAEGLRELALHMPDALVLDLGLPDMDGKEVLEKARGFYQRPILILSARERSLEKIQALDLGADDYIQKPFDVKEFLARLRAALRNKATRFGASAFVKTGDTVSIYEDETPAQRIPAAMTRVAGALDPRIGAMADAAE